MSSVSTLDFSSTLDIMYSTCSKVCLHSAILPFGRSKGGSGRESSLDPQEITQR